MRYALLICTDESQMEAASPEESGRERRRVHGVRRGDGRPRPAAGWRAAPADDRRDDRAGPSTARC